MLIRNAALEWVSARRTKSRRLLGVVAATLALSGVAACTRAQGRAERMQGQVDELAPYPPGSWRVARFELPRTFLTLSHVLIAHTDSKSGEDSTLRAPNWSAERRVQRTREEARSLAGSIAAQARLAPASFPSLARQYSDDLTNNERAGSLGTWCAQDLPPEFLDALSTLQAGETSRVVETPLGFHVLKLRPTAAETTVAARRILIGYASTASSPGKLPAERSREQAELLAKDVAARAAAEPQRFSELVERYSEHQDVLRGGDFGQWTNLERNGRRREIEVISGLTIGEVSGPVDGTEGFSIFLRTELTPRARLAVKRLMVQVEPESAPSAASLAARLPQDVRPLLRGDDQGFEQLQAKYCCRGVHQWRQGRGDPRVEKLLEGLAPGAVAVEPIALERDGYQFVKRAEPEAEAPREPILLALPQGRQPDVDRIVSKAGQGEAVAKFLVSMRNVSGDGLGLALDPERQKRLSLILDRMEQSMRSAPAAETLTLLQRAREEMREVLSEREFAALQANVRSRLTRQLLEAR
jgi:hypothetical protein